MTLPAIIADRYETQDRIGQGGMGSLFRARDRVLDRIVAIKVLREGFDDEELKVRFVREARAAARLTHRHIVTIHDFGEHLGQPYIVMEYIAGETLAQMIAEQRPLSLLRKLGLIEDLSVGLAFAHRAGVVHRDIKPANVIVDGEGVLKILDFGIAQFGESNVTKGNILGTLNYMAPEQISGQSDARSDIFAVGALCYELLSYRRAFPGGFEDGVLSRILNDPPEPLSLVRPGLEPQIERIVMRALEKDPAKRYQELAALRHDVARVRERIEREQASVDAVTRTLDLPRLETPARTPSGPWSESALSDSQQPDIESILDASRCALASGDPDKALVACEQALAINPGNTIARTLIDEIRRALETRRVRALADVVRARLDQGALTSASAVLDNLVAIAPGSEEALALSAELARRKTGGTVIEGREGPTTAETASKRRATFVLAAVAASVLLVLGAAAVERGWWTARPSETVVGQNAPAAAPAPVNVRIDAKPWARVTIRPAAGQPPVAADAQVTPFTIALPAGEYDLSLENGGLTRPATEHITVAANQPNEVRVTMPGFDPDRVVSALLGPGP